MTLTPEQRDLEARLDEAVRDALVGGIDPELVAEWVVEQIRAWHTGDLD